MTARRSTGAATRRQVSEDVQVAGSGKGSFFGTAPFSVVPDGSARAAARRDWPDLDQRVALHHVIALVEIDRGVAMRRRQDHLLGQTGSGLAFGCDHRQVL